MNNVTLPRLLAPHTFAQSDSFTFPSVKLQGRKTLEEIGLRVTGSIACVNGSLDVVTVGSGSAVRDAVISDIEIAIKDPSNIIIKGLPSQFYQDDAYTDRAPATSGIPAVADLTALASGGAYAFSFYIPLPFLHSEQKGKAGSLLGLRKQDFGGAGDNPDVYIKITAGSNVDSFLGGADATNYTMTAFAVEPVLIERWDDAISTPFLPFATRKSVQSLANTSASSDVEIDLDRGDILHRLVIKVDDNATLSDSDVTNVKVFVDSLMVADTTFLQLRDKNFNDSGRVAANDTGYAVLDFDSKRNSNGLDLRAAGDVKLRVTTGASVTSVNVRVLQVSTRARKVA